MRFRTDETTVGFQIPVTLRHKFVTLGRKINRLKCHRLIVQIYNDSYTYSARALFVMHIGGVVSLSSTANFDYPLRSVARRQRCLMTPFVWKSSGICKTFHRPNKSTFLKQICKRHHLETTLKLNRMRANNSPFAPYYRVRNFQD
jgi:hypothetical protein